MEEPAVKLGHRFWLREGVLAMILLGIGQGAGLLNRLLNSSRLLSSEFG